MKLKGITDKGLKRVANKVKGQVEEFDPDAYEKQWNRDVREEFPEADEAAEEILDRAVKAFVDSAFFDIMAVHEEDPEGNVSGFLMNAMDDLMESGSLLEELKEYWETKNVYHFG